MRRRHRRAGIIAPLTHERPPEYLLPADFNTATPDGVHWRTPIRGGYSGNGDLCVSSGARLLYDLQAELHLTDAQRRRWWSRQLLADLAHGLSVAGVPPRGVSVPSIPTDDAVEVPADWLRVAIWFTYHRTEHPGDWRAVELPRIRSLPMMRVAVIPEGTPTLAETWCLRGSAGRDLPIRGETIDVTGTPPPATRRRSSSAAPVVLALAALAALAFK